MDEKIIEERKLFEIYRSIKDWDSDHPDVSTMCRALVKLEINSRGNRVEPKSLVEGEYMFGDFTEIRIWNSPIDFVRRHIHYSSVGHMLDNMVEKIAGKITPRFREGYLIEAVGLRDRNGADIEQARIPQDYPNYVYYAPDETKKLQDARKDDVPHFFRAVDERQERDSNLVLQLN